MKFGNRIAQLRDERKLTQEELAQKLSINRAALSHYENNRREPDYETLQRIATYFRVSIDFLMGGIMDSSEISDPNVKQFIDGLELSDQTLLNKFALTIDGRKLTSEEAKRFIAFIRADRAMN